MTAAGWYCRLQLLGCQANGGNFRVREGSAGEERFILADRQEWVGNALHDTPSLGIGRVRERGGGRHISNGVYTLDRRLTKAVDLDPVPVKPNPGLLQPERIDVAHPADRYQNLVHILDFDFLIPGLRSFRVRLASS